VHRAWCADSARRSEAKVLNLAWGNINLVLKKLTTSDVVNSPVPLMFWDVGSKNSILVRVRIAGT
jgi:hypothetical protein